jgi:excisionase family DNA binding protein
MSAVVQGASIAKLITLRELAEAWRVSPHTVRSWVRKGRLHSTRISTRLLFDPQECERFLSARNGVEASNGDDAKRN